MKIQGAEAAEARVKDVEHWATPHRTRANVGVRLSDACRAALEADSE